MSLTQARVSLERERRNTLELVERTLEEALDYYEEVDWAEQTLSLRLATSAIDLALQAVLSEEAR